MLQPRMTLETRQGRQRRRGILLRQTGRGDQDSQVDYPCRDQYPHLHLGG